ncbi:MAG: hypothetical protein ACLVJH_15205 [Faecalibacterium prausnitzii]
MPWRRDSRCGKKICRRSRRRLNDWAARECPVLHTPPAGNAIVSIHLDRMTVESVRHLDQLAPYGLRTPPGVPAAKRRAWTAYTRYRRAGTAACVCGRAIASLYAVWFGMPPEQLPYAMGDVVDAALNLSVYDSPRGAQLSGRILDLHPAGLGTELARAGCAGAGAAPRRT